MLRVRLSEWEAFFNVYETLDQLALHLTAGVWPLLMEILTFGTTPLKEDWGGILLEMP